MPALITIYKDAMGRVGKMRGDACTAAQQGNGKEASRLTQAAADLERDAQRLRTEIPAWQWDAWLDDSHEPDTGA